jgi:hypothetical protein
VDAWLELGDDDTNESTSVRSTVSAAAVGSAGLKPTPRYGHVMVLDDITGTITVFGGSGSTYLNDVIQFDLFDDTEDEDDD